MVPRQLTDAAWASLRRVTPSFAPFWCDYKAGSYDPAIPYVGISQLARYVAIVLSSKESVAKLRPLFREIEHLLATGGPDLRALLTIGFFEDLIDGDLDGLTDSDLRRVYSMLRGKHSVQAWRAAVAYTCPEATWHARRGLVRQVRSPALRGVLVAWHAARDKDRTLTVFGHLRKGSVRAGYYLRYCISEYSHVYYPAAAVQRLRPRTWPQLVKLTLRYGTERQEALVRIFESIAFEPATLMIYARRPGHAA